jgi:hypothetical protein
VTSYIIDDLRIGTESLDVRHIGAPNELLGSVAIA